MLLVEYSVLDKVKVINESKNGITKLKLLGKFQKCDEQNNNGRVYPRKVLENQVKTIQEKIGDRSLVGALDHPANDAIHLSQASHLITKLWVEKNGDVMGECEILSTPNGKIVEALINDGVKIGISSRGLGSVSEGSEGKIVNEDFKLVTFDLVSDPSTKGAFPGLCESMRENSERAQRIVSKHKKDRVLLTMLESKINEALKGNQKELDKDGNKKINKKDFKMMRGDSDTDEGSEGEGSVGEKSEFSDLNRDGKTTFADILVGKLKGKKKTREGHDLTKNVPLTRTERATARSAANPAGVGGKPMTKEERAAEQARSAARQPARIAKATEIANARTLPKPLPREDSSMSFNERVISKIKHKFEEAERRAAWDAPIFPKRDRNEDGYNDDDFSTAGTQLAKARIDKKTGQIRGPKNGPVTMQPKRPNSNVTR